MGEILTGYSAAELLGENGTRHGWHDLPIRLEWGSNRVIAVSWSKFDDLWIGTDLSLPFCIEGTTVRWVRNGSEVLNRVLGATLTSVWLGRGEFSLEVTQEPIWAKARGVAIQHLSITDFAQMTLPMAPATSVVCIYITYRIAVWIVLALGR